MTILRTNTIAGLGETFGPSLEGDLEFNSQNYIVLPKGSSNQQGVLRTTEDVIGVGGTYYDNLVLAMPFNEATGLRDVSSRNRNPGTYGNVAISTAQSKYYGSSAYFDGSGDYIKIQNTGNDLAFGTEDFTIEFWTYLNSTADSHFYDSRDIDNVDRPLIWIQNTLIRYYVSGATRISGSALSTGQWYHISVCRFGTSTKLFLNGFQTGSTYTDTTDYKAPNSLSICSNENGNSRFINGYLQDLRIYKGIAKYTANFTPPERIAETGVGFKTGQLRYNTDSNKPELYDGNQWTELQISNVGLGTAGDTGPGARGVFGGGNPLTNVIQYINISSTGNSQDFGDLQTAKNTAVGLSSKTRGVFCGGSTVPARQTDLEYITISSTGDAIDYGDLTTSRSEAGAASNNTRGLVAGGSNSPAGDLSSIEYFSISSGGTGQSFGNLTDARERLCGNVNSPTRACFFGGQSPAVNTIEFVTIASLGNAQDFGDLLSSSINYSGASNPTRGIIHGSITSPYETRIEHITISTLGNSIKFGDLTVARALNASTSSSTRAVFAGGQTPATSSVIDYVTILTQGNAVDFGDLYLASVQFNGLSNAHGGL